MNEAQRPIHQWWTESFLKRLLDLRGTAAADLPSEDDGLRVVEKSIRVGAFTVKLHGRRESHEVTIGAKLLSDARWRRAEGALAGDLALLARAMAGRWPDSPPLPREVGGIYHSSNDDPTATCSCGATACRHIRHAVEAVAHELDADPLLACHVRGRPRRELAEAVAVAGTGAATVTSRGSKQTEIADFWGERWCEPERPAAPEAGVDGLESLERAAVADAPERTVEGLLSAYRCFGRGIGGPSPIGREADSACLDVDGLDDGGA